MKIKELKEIIENLPDDWDIEMWQVDGTDFDGTHVDANWYPMNRAETSIKYNTLRLSID